MADTAHEKTLRELRELIDDLTDPDPCQFDHHGYCQTHGWFDTEPACPHARAKAILAGLNEAGSTS